MTTYLLRHASGIAHGSGVHGVAVCEPWTWDTREKAELWQRHLAAHGMPTVLEVTPETAAKEGAD